MYIKNFLFEGDIFCIKSNHNFYHFIVVYIDHLMLIYRELLEPNYKIITYNLNSLIRNDEFFILDLNDYYDYRLINKRIYSEKFINFMKEITKEGSLDRFIWYNNLLGNYLIKFEEDYMTLATIAVYNGNDNILEYLIECDYLECNMTNLNFLCNMCSYQYTLDLLYKYM